MATFDSKTAHDTTVGEEASAIIKMIDEFQANDPSWQVVITFTDSSTETQGVAFTYANTSMYASADIEATISSGKTVDKVELQYLDTETTTMHEKTGLNESFPYGGTFIIESYAISYTSTEGVV